MNNAPKIFKTVLAGTALISLATVTHYCTVASAEDSPVPTNENETVVIQVEAQKTTPGSMRAQPMASTTHGANARMPARGLSDFPSPQPPQAPQMIAAAVIPTQPTPDSLFDAARQRMVSEQLAAPSRGIVNKSVLGAMSAVPRHQFVFSEELSDSYADKALKIGTNRTLESPYVVAWVAEQLGQNRNYKVLELGTGVGYQTVVLSKLVSQIYSVEPQEQLAQGAIVNFERLGYTNNVFVRHGDLSQGWPEAAPFDALVVNAGSDSLSQTVLDQLKEGGRIILAVEGADNIIVSKKQGGQKIQQASRSMHPQPVGNNSVSIDQFRRPVANVNTNK